MNEKRPDERKRTRVEGEVAPGHARRVSRGPLLTAPAEVRAVLAAIVESSDDAIVGKTLDGTIMTWNAGAERVFGYTAEEAQIVATLRRGERIDHFETERVRKDGRRIHISLSVSPIRNARGEIIGAAKIARDITEQKHLDVERQAMLVKERAARALAEGASRTKDVFLAMISHELRSPLSPILAWARLLRQGVLDAEKTKRALETIERSARSQAQLIDDLLDISRTVAGKLRLQVCAVQLTR